MIQRISSSISNVSFKKSNKSSNPIKSECARSRKGDYVDSFVKHTKESIAPMLALTGIWSILDNRVSAIPLKKAIPQNLIAFFLPVTIVSSAILAGMENKK